ncbi:hypothetical protein WJX72_002308 [[Myrmecia] bisecta]|uniref:lycopene beta-cyclase n=1 Tax=[Myrmecia] bisecta TaxID=41462 RepID=A0AAW1R5R5_9CHLO
MTKGRAKGAASVVSLDAVASPDAALPPGVQQGNIEIAILGGGICGVLAAQRCAEAGIPFHLLEREADFGGVWGTLANSHSHLQAFEAFYRWHESFPLAANPLSKLSGPQVLGKIREFAAQHKLSDQASFNTTVVNVKQQGERYLIESRDTKTGDPKYLLASFVFVTTGILGRQLTAEERGLTNGSEYQGILTLAGRSEGKDSLVGSTDLTGKDVVIIGSGAFACEAMEAANRNNARHITMISRPRKRWVLPFSRQFTTTFLAYMPLVPWHWKMALTRRYLINRFYKPCGLKHMAPSGPPSEQDYTGQCNDAFFKLSKSGKVTHLLDSVSRFTKTGVMLKSGGQVKAEMVVIASGCKFEAVPLFMKELKLGFNDLYNLAFMGDSGRIGTASDFVYAFVPEGPKRQIDLFLHSYTCHKQGNMAEFCKVLKPTPIPKEEGKRAGGRQLGTKTWFETRGRFSVLNYAMQERSEVYYRTMSVGRSLPKRVVLGAGMKLRMVVFWLISCLFAAIETLKHPQSLPGKHPSDVKPGSSKFKADIQLPQYQDREPGTVHLIVAGAGPSGLAVAERVSAAGFKVVVIDPVPLSAWPNNYGVWVDEMVAMGLDDCLEAVWPSATVLLGSGPQNEKALSRPYGRVDRPKLKRKLLEGCVKQGVLFHQSTVESVKHTDGLSTIVTKDGLRISGSMVLDATGHQRKLVEFDKKFDPGYQGAYGIMCEVESHPFDLDKMLFMDWRDDHLDNHPEVQMRNSKLPTFLYAMPFSPTYVFLEETSLVARPAIPFDELKLRLELRMQHLGVKITRVEEEEYCLIPMGGVLPTFPQRVLGIGGTGGMVHPSTGYMVARMLGMAPILADAIIDQLSAASDKAVNSSAPVGALTEQESFAMAASVWNAIWPVERLRQREFFLFGMDVLLKLDLQETRDFFTAFFSLNDYNWRGFLSTRLSFAELIAFGLSLFAKSSNATRANLLVKGLPGLAAMGIHLTQSLGYNARMKKAGVQKIVK